MLQWARARVRLEPEAVARGITSDPDKFLAWEEGEALPTLAQARKLADRLRVPFGYLFLCAPPDPQLPIPDLRTRGDRRLLDPSPDLFDQVALTLAKQQWFSRYRLNLGMEAIPKIGDFSIETAAAEVAQDLRQTLRLADFQFEAGSWDAFLTDFVRTAEEIGILVMRSGVVGNNSHRPLDVDEFQGFAIADPHAPLIFINSRDFITARIFTLAHELAHLWIGASGVTFIDPVEPSLVAYPLEAWCNAVAAEMLVPDDDLKHEWRMREEIGEEALRIARRFRVSTIVVLRRTLDMGLITRDKFFAQLRIERERQTVRRVHGGGNQINNILARNSRLFTESLVSATLEGRVGYAEASRLLGVKVETIRSLAQELRIR